mmetsp:Transcript_88005/g.247320  ORF Transcript_88005/g.247320 Transcript_88005/m.247320 type:complete len:271 (+) Transcript_88005:165-977(+)
MEKMSGESAVASLHEDHEDQMQLGIRIITSAFTNKMNSLDQEIRGMRLTCEEQRSNVASLHKKNSALEVELVEGHQRAQQLQEENKELFKTVGSLRKQIARLEALKSAVLSSIQDDAVQEAELGDTKVLMSEEFLRAATPLTTRELGHSSGQTDSRGVAALPSLSAALPQRDAPQEPLNYGGNSGPMGGLTSTSPGGDQASPAIDGKQFFRQARNRLSYEAFNLFLASIKRLNNQTQTREETLEEARRIFGTELHELYKDFEALLNRHGM